MCKLLSTGSNVLRVALAAAIVLGVSSCGRSRDSSRFTFDLERPFGGAPEIATMIESMPTSTGPTPFDGSCFTCVEYFDGIDLKAGGRSIGRYDIYDLLIGKWFSESKPLIVIGFNRVELEALRPLIEWFQTKPGATINATTRGVSNPCDANCWRHLTDAHSCSSSFSDDCKWSVYVDNLQDEIGNYHLTLTGHGPGWTTPRLSVVYDD